MLFIFRKNKWDLPKGKVEKGETLENGAMREVEEETGVKKLKLISFAGMTYHVFRRNNQYRLKETYWFHMTTNFWKLKPEAKRILQNLNGKAQQKWPKHLKILMKTSSIYSII